MMQMRSFPMSRSDGSKISLEELLSVVPGSEWTWYVLDFYGIGCAPAAKPWSLLKKRYALRKMVSP